MRNPWTLCLLLLSFTALAQQQAATAPARALHFDVVSVHEYKPKLGESFTMRYGSDRHTSHQEFLNISRNDLVRQAFGLRPFQVEGLTGLPWVLYTLHASGDEATEAALKAMTDAEATEAQHRMLLEVLVDRFHLQYHFVTRDMPSYLLVAGKQPKLKASAVKPLAPGELARKDDPTSPWIDWHHSAAGWSIDFRGQTMAKLADLLVPYLEAPITDRTDLPGLWDFHLDFWSPAMNGHRQPPDDAFAEPEIGLPAQLGLRLERGKAPMQILVVDHIEAPTPN